MEYFTVFFFFLLFSKFVVEFILIVYLSSEQPYVDSGYFFGHPGSNR